MMLKFLFALLFFMQFATFLADTDTDAITTTREGADDVDTDNDS